MDIKQFYDLLYICIDIKICLIDFISFHKYCFLSVSYLYKFLFNNLNSFDKVAEIFLYFWAILKVQLFSSFCKYL